jgi:hypothetical protein
MEYPPYLSMEIIFVQLKKIEGVEIGRCDK